MKSIFLFRCLFFQLGKVMLNPSTAAPPIANRAHSSERYHSRRFQSGQGPPARRAPPSVFMVSHRTSI